MDKKKKENIHISVETKRQKEAKVRRRYVTVTILRIEVFQLRSHRGAKYFIYTVVFIS